MSFSPPADSFRQPQGDAKSVPLPPPSGTSGIGDDDYEQQNPQQGEITLARRKPFDFPFKLHKMLEEAVDKGYDHIVSWLPSGLAFRIHHRNDFASKILPRYFSTTKFKSFVRQLNIYSFYRVDHVQSGGSAAAYGAYWHKLFTRSNPSLCFGMKRTKNKRAIVTSIESSMATLKMNQQYFERMIAPSINSYKNDIATTTRLDVGATVSILPRCAATHGGESRPTRRPEALVQLQSGAPPAAVPMATNTISSMMLNHQQRTQQNGYYLVAPSPVSTDDTNTIEYQVRNAAAPFCGPRSRHTSWHRPQQQQQQQQEVGTANNNGTDLLQHTSEHLILALDSSMKTSFAILGGGGGGGENNNDNDSGKTGQDMIRRGRHADTTATTNNTSISARPSSYQSTTMTHGCAGGDDGKLAADTIITPRRSGGNHPKQISLNPSPPPPKYYSPQHPHDGWSVVDDHDHHDRGQYCHHEPLTPSTLSGVQWLE